jgi:hypothetical protein
MCRVLCYIIITIVNLLIHNSSRNESGCSSVELFDSKRTWSFVRSNLSYNDGTDLLYKIEESALDQSRCCF